MRCGKHCNSCYFFSAQKHGTLEDTSSLWLVSEALLVPERKCTWEIQSDTGVLGSEWHDTDAVLGTLERATLFRVI